MDCFRSLFSRCVAIAIALVAAGRTLAPTCCAAAESRPKKIVLLAGTVHQGPGGHPAGTHEYELSARLLKQALATSAEGANLKIEVHGQGWPVDEKTLDDADTIVVLSDGADRDPQDHPLLVSERLSTLKRQMARGCGLVAIHWTVFVPQKRGGEEFLEWIGGYFDYESGSAANHWYSKIQTASTRPAPATPKHPICRGVEPFELREEYYYNIRFRPNDPRLVPILSTPIPGEAKEQTVAWAVERAEGGRGFGFTGGHFFDNWGVENFRRMVLNAILWTAHYEVPAGGVRSAQPAVAEQPPAPEERPIQALIVTGHQHGAHVWRDTTVALQDALSQDRRMQTTVATDPEILATDQLAGYDVLVLNYCNWQRPGLSDAAKENFQKYLKEGGGLVIVHFSNGAFHVSLPETPASDWPEYRNICRRVWDHAPGRSSHDPYGKFRVNITADHSITAGMNSFETIDELYTKQQGDAPIEVLATARSSISGKEEPMAFVYNYGKGRVFQTVLGHAAESIRVPGEAALFRRGAVWAAGREQRAVVARPAATTTSAPKLAPEGRFGAALDPRPGAASVARKELYDRRPLTVECWSKLQGKAGFNILVANNSKESAEHWELYSYAGTGELSLYLPGFEPAEIRSGVSIVDGGWHHVAGAFDEKQARMFVDGKLVKETAIARKRSGGPTAALFFGGYPPHNIGCDGLVDEVRVSNALRAIDGIPSAPFSADEHTIGLWHFDRLEGGAVEDVSTNKNVAVSGERQVAGPLLSRRVVDLKLRLVSIDTSPDESFLSIRADTTGRLFVGGREALFVYEPDPRGGYLPRQLLYRFPPDTWLTDVEIRGDDLYVMTNAALYLFPGGRTARENLQPKRLLWGTPVDLHVTWHGLAWGPEGDLYFSSGDPLLNFGDFQNRPDHWGHWTIYSQPEGTKVPYTGVGGFFRCRPDGSGLQVVAGGTRGAVGIAFDRRWNLFSNDNDHESIAERYSPARLLHVAPKANFFWPRGWIAGMSPERSDLLEIANTGMGREAPVGQTYYDDVLLGPEYRDSVLVARWGQRKVDGFRLAPRGASYQAEEFPVLAGEETARPVGVAVGRGGRVFAALSYMAGNEWSPKYPSELVMITRADDSASFPFEAYDAPAVAPDRLWKELADPSWGRRQRAHNEILRRAGELLSDAARRLAKADPGDPALVHLIWLAAASRGVETRLALEKLARHADPSVRVQAIRALGEFYGKQTPANLLVDAVADPDAKVQHAALVNLFDSQAPLPASLFEGPALSSDTYLRQVGAFLLARRASDAELARLFESSDPRQRLAGVLATGFRLTVPPAIGEVPSSVNLSYESGNALFVINYADETVDLKKLARTGSFTTADRWRVLGAQADQQRLFKSLVQCLDDEDDRVRLQAGYFLSLLNDPPTNTQIAASRRSMILKRLITAPRVSVERAWTIGPFDGTTNSSPAVRAIGDGAIDLSAAIDSGNGELAWKTTDAKSGFAVPAREAAGKTAVSYYYFRVQSLQEQPAVVRLGCPAGSQVWHNASALDEERPCVLALDPGTNNFVVRVEHAAHPGTLTVVVQAAERIESTMPEKLDAGGLAERLKQAGAGATAVPAEFLKVDWQQARSAGDAQRGRRLFGADALGCVKCHAILPGQKGGGAPSLAAAGSRFTVAHLVESILVPSKQVAPVFGTTSIALDDGTTITGLAVEENERELVLLLPTALRQTVSKDRIEVRKLQEVSPMPSGLVKTVAELGDLLAYLMSPHPQAP